MSTIGLQPSSPSSATLIATASESAAISHTSSEHDMAREPISPLRPSHPTHSSRQSPSRSPNRQHIDEKRSMLPSMHHQRSPLVSQSVPRSLPAGGEQNASASTSPIRRAGTVNSPPPMYRASNPAEQASQAGAEHLHRTRGKQTISRSGSPANSSAPSRRDSVASGSTARLPDARTPLFSKAQINLADRRDERAQDEAGGTAAKRAPAGEETRPLQPDDEEDELDASDMESEEGGGRPNSGDDNGRGRKNRTSGESRRMVETEKDSADFAYEYVPVVQRRDNREKM